MLDRFGMELSVNSAELWIHPQRELSGIVAQPDPLGNAGEDLRRHVVEAVGSRVAAQRSRAEVRVDGRGQFLCRIAKDVVEGVVPDAADPHERRAVRLLRHHELAREVEDPGDVIVIDVTDHDAVDRQRMVRGQAAGSRDRLEPRFEMPRVHRRGAAVDDREPGIGAPAEVQQETIALPGSPYIQAENHADLTSSETP
jgi:hypothetical protein